MSVLKKPYEISIWDDILVFEIKRENSDVTEIILPEDAKNITDNFTLIRQFYKEEKIAIIGSDTMSAPWRAVDPSLVENVNGSSTLTFTMYAKYYDEEAEENLDNPFTKKMVNERKIKLLYNNKWYDFIIKNIQENSDSKSYTYTAKDLFINELSKTGYDLIFDSDLENNLGTIDYLADQILEGSDWKRESGDVVREYKEEPVYLITTTAEFTATRMLSLENEIGPSTVTLPVGTKIYGFYHCVNSNLSFFQFLYRSDLDYTDYPKDDDRVIVNTPNYYIDGAIDSSTGSFIYFNKDEAVLSNEYRGKRLVRNISTKYDPVSERYVNVYEDSSSNTVYGYTDFEYITTGSVTNYVVNSSGYTSTDGWSAAANVELSLYTLPSLSSATVDSDFKTYLKWKGTNYLVNSCITENRSLIKSFAKGEYYVLRVKFGYLKSDGTIGKTNVGNSTAGGLNFYIAEYKLEDGTYKIVNNNILFSFKHNNFLDSSGYRYLSVPCAKAVSYDDLLNHKYGLLISEEGTLNRTYCIEDVQFFKYVQTEADIVYPNEVISAEVKTKYLYYLYDENIKDKDLIEYIYQGYEPSSEYTAIYDEDCQKQRSIKASESNRFNLIQSLCETFGCWAKFRIEHNQDTGEILLDEDGRQKKWISFHEYVGKDNYIGFKYGINLKSILRTIDSSEIATKLIVKNNSNEYADGGFCSIARASENPTGENFLLDFSHYINQGLLNFSQFNNDLYISSNGYLGYYLKLKELNNSIEENSNLQAELISKTLPNLRSQYTNYKVMLESLNEQFVSQQNQIYKITGKTYSQLLNDKSNSWWNDNDVYSLLLSTSRLKQNISQTQAAFNAINTTLYGSDSNSGVEKQLEELQSEIEDITNQKKELDALFYQKYSRYLQEGSWISEDYIDDNLYYLDAESTLHTSSQPKVTYTINVLELSQVEGYELYQFEVGDKTFIEDTEFFGWTDIIKSTPYKEEVVVTEVKIKLDDPSQNTITVKNYKTQFEDLFQRITAVTTSVQFSTGEYQKVANTIESDGTIKASVLQNSLSNNAIVLSNSNNNSVVTDASGITTINLSKPNEMVRIVGGGIFLSNDFGTTWNTGITGGGINANYITSGVLNTQLIQIWNNGYPTFRWDTNGISAYYFEQDESGELTNYSAARFVRFDQYGLYGIESDSAFSPSSESDILNKSSFSLTWSGFQLKSHHMTDDGSGSSGYISISTNNDFQLFDGNKIERIKIGLITLSDGGTSYGMVFKDNNGLVTLQTDDSGKLFLKDIIRIGPDLRDEYRDRVKLGVSASYDEQSQTTSVDDEKVFSKILSITGDSSISNTVELDSSSNEVLAIFDDGTLLANKLKASGASIEGAIYATSGKIGNVEITDFENTIDDTRGIKIIAEKGLLFKKVDDSVSPTSLPLYIELVGYESKSSYIYKWEYSSDFTTWNTISENSESIDFEYSDSKFDTNGMCYIKLSFYDGTTIIKTVYETITVVENGEKGADGESGITFRIDSSSGFLINEDDEITSTTLTARIFKGAEELDADNSSGWVYTWYDKMESESDFETAIAIGKSITYDLTQFLKYSQIYFTVETDSSNITLAYSDGEVSISSESLVFENDESGNVSITSGIQSVSSDGNGNVSIV